VAAAGLDHPGALKPHHFLQRGTSDTVITYAEQYEQLLPGQLIADPTSSKRFGEAWRVAQAHSFDRLTA